VYWFVNQGEIREFPPEVRRRDHSATAAREKSTSQPKCMTIGFCRELRVVLYSLRTRCVV